jgi:hypothetical protein
MLTSCLALVITTNMVTLVTGNVHYLAKNPGGAHTRTSTVKWTDKSQGTSCGIMSSVQSDFVADRRQHTGQQHRSCISQLRNTGLRDS